MGKLGRALATAAGGDLLEAKWSTGLCVRLSLVVQVGN